MPSLDEISSFGFERRTVYVVGASESGRSLVRYLLRRGDRVFLSDIDAGRALDSETARLGGELSFSRGRHDFAFAARADLVVLSPGVPIDATIAQFARSRAKIVMSTAEFVASESSAQLIVVTGTSGKTTTVEVLRALVGSDAEAGTIFLTDRGSGVGLAGALERPHCRQIIAELPVAELAGVRRLDPALLVVTNLAEVNNHAEYGCFEAYLRAKLGWLGSLESRLPIVTGPRERAAILRHLARPDETTPPLEFEIVPDEVGPILALAERVRRVMVELGLESTTRPRQILDAIRSTLLAGCESIEGFAMPILNIGECKNPDSLRWTANAICVEPRIITARSLAGDARGPSGDVIDLNQTPVALEDAIAMWTTRGRSDAQGTIVIDELTRKKLFSRDVL